MRLVDGPSDHEGKLEVLYNGEWRTVCEWEFDRADADVACRQLGYNGSAATYIYDMYTYNGVGRVWLNHLNCIGNETSLDECDHAGWASNHCGHNRDVAIICAVADLGNCLSNCNTSL